MITQEQIDLLKRAIALGVFEVAEKDRVTRYRTLDEMMETLRWMEAQLAGGGGDSGPVIAPENRYYRTVATYEKGLR